jgi:hypothetical protein
MGELNIIQVISVSHDEMGQERIHMEQEMPENAVTDGKKTLANST